MQVRLKTQLTPATRWGPVVQGLLVALGVAAVITAILHNGSFVRRLGRRSKDGGRSHDHTHGEQQWQVAEQRIARRAHRLEEIADDGGLDPAQQVGLA